MKSAILASIALALAIPTSLRGEDLNLNTWSTMSQAVRNYSNDFRKIDRSIPLEQNQLEAGRIIARRKAIETLLFSKTNGQVLFSSRDHALRYIMESTIENAFYPGFYRDPRVDLFTDYKRHSTFISAFPYLQTFEEIGSRAIRPIYLQYRKPLDLSPKFGAIQFFRQFCPGKKTSNQTINQTCSRHSEKVENCKAALTEFCDQEDPVLNASSPDHSIFVPAGGGGSCVSDGSNGSNLNLKIGFVLEALMRRGRIVPVGPAERKKLAKTHPRGAAWLKMASPPVNQSRPQMSTRLSPELPDYDLLGLYDCTKDSQGLSGKIYIDATMNPYDLATFVLHELNHFAADKFSTPPPGLSPNEISYLEDVGSFTLSALSQIEQTLRHSADRRYENSKLKNRFTSIAPYLEGQLSTFYGDLSSFHDYGDLTRFSIGREGAGALNAYLEGESRVNQFVKANSQYGFSGASTPLCRALDLLNEGWLYELDKPRVASSHSRLVPSLVYPNIYHQIAGGCYSDLNVSQLRRQRSEAAMKFKYTPILDLLKSWDVSLGKFTGRTEVQRLKELRQVIDSHVEAVLQRVSPTCRPAFGTDGGKSGADGGKSGVDGGKAGVEGGKP